MADHASLSRRKSLGVRSVTTISDLVELGPVRCAELAAPHDLAAVYRYVDAETRLASLAALA
jgi:hypothetical protein